MDSERGALISELSLEDFRGIRKTKKPLALTEFNVLVGRNNSGKSSVLESLGLVPVPHSTVDSLGFGRIQSIAASHSNSYDSLVYGYTGKALITYKIGKDIFPLTLEWSNQHLGEYYDVDPELRPPNFQGQGTLDQRVRMSEVAPLRMDKQSSLFYSPNLYQQFLGQVENPSSWSVIEKSKAHNKVFREVINPTIEDRYTELTLRSIDSKNVLHARKEFPDGTSMYVRLTELGTGIQTTIIPLLVIETVNPTIVLWDDFGSELHPSLIENIMRWLAERDWQVVISTHSVDVLAALADVKPKGAQVIVLRKSNEDILEHSALSMEQLSTYFEGNADPRKYADDFGL